MNEHPTTELTDAEDDALVEAFCNLDALRVVAARIKTDASLAFTQPEHETARKVAQQNAWTAGEAEGYCEAQERVRAALALLTDEHITPVGKQQIERALTGRGPDRTMHALDDSLE